MTLLMIHRGALVYAAMHPDEAEHAAMQVSHATSTCRESGRKLESLWWMPSTFTFSFVYYSLHPTEQFMR